jgi:hypothetical protein
MGMLLARKFIFPLMLSVFFLLMSMSLTAGYSIYSGQSPSILTITLNNDSVIYIYPDYKSDADGKVFIFSFRENNIGFTLDPGRIRNISFSYQALKRAGHPGKREDLRNIQVLPAEGMYLPPG